MKSKKQDIIFKKINIAQNVQPIRQLLNCSFKTVMDEFGLTKKDVPTSPAFIDEDAILKSANEVNMEFYGYWENQELIACYALNGKDDFVELHRVCVRPDKRHSGIGKLLLDDSTRNAFAKGAKKIMINIINENVRLKNWYIAYGYYEVENKKYDHLPFGVCRMEYKKKI